MKRFYNYLINFGVNASHTNHYNKKVKLLNIFCVLFYHGFIMSSILTITSNRHYSTLLTVNIFGFLYVIIIHLLNKNGRYNASGIGLLLYAIFYFLLTTCFVSPERFIEFYYILLPSTCLVFFEKEIYSWIIFIISLIGFHIPFLVFGYYKSDTILFFSPLMIFLFTASFLIVLYFKKLNIKNEKLLALERDKVSLDKIVLEKQKKELRALNEFKSHFFVNLSHEIRTPLTLIKGHASQINLNDSKVKNLERMEIIESQSEQIEFIINNIMDLSKMDTIELQLDSKYIDTSSFLNKHYTNFKGLFDDKNITFFLENNLKNLAFKIDENLFSKSINNLLNNALKFTSRGGNVILKAYLEEKKLKIEVIDNGIGIPEIDIKHIFDRFFQSKNHITKSQGSGIGLSFTKRIIDAHDFSIDVKSIPNTETIFSIEIPSNVLQKKEFKPIETLTISKDFSTTKNTIKTNSNRKILIVEDHEQMRNYISSLLNNYNITVAENGKVALDILKTESFDIIVTDYMMPVMDGEIFVSEIKKQNLKTPIIVLTARTDNAGKLNMLRLGIDGYLNKPFLKEELFMHIKQAFKAHDVINNFDKKLKEEEKENLNKFAQTFNEDLKEFIFKNMHTSNFGVDAIAEHFNISKSTLNRKVRSLLGQVPKDIILEARLQKARLLLEENPTETQKNIANAVGISNTSYFFKKMEERFYEV